MTVAVGNQIAQNPSAFAASAALSYRAAAAPVDFVALTPESLLFFCQSRLREMDDAIAQKMRGQTDLVALQGAIGNIQSALKSESAGRKDGVAFDSPEAIARLTSALDAAIDRAEACGDNTAAKSLRDVKAKLVGPEKDSLVDPQEVTDMSAMLDTAITSSRSAAEVSMIELQSIVSKRSTMLQLTTGMMNSINEGAKSIAGNIGR